LGGTIGCELSTANSTLFDALDKGENEYGFAPHCHSGDPRFLWVESLLNRIYPFFSYIPAFWPYTQVSSDLYGKDPTY
jgi:hypothetical protein